MRATTNQSSGEFPVLDEGGYVARVYSIVDIGVHQTNFGAKQQVVVTWELPTELGTDGLPYCISKFYTLSLHEKASLRKAIESMKGKIPDDKLTDQKFVDGLFQKTLGTPCQLSISQYENKEGYMRNGIEAIGKLIKGTAVPEAVNEPVLLDLDNFKQEAFDKVPEWIQGKVVEGRAALKGGAGDDNDDDIPFDKDSPATDEEADW